MGNCGVTKWIKEEVVTYKICPNLVPKTLMFSDFDTVDDRNNAILDYSIILI
jgi:hypothetical protein